ncbi:HAD family phosphatase [Kiritimatiellaeota bacterium B1221]|nr:HAD family phosphatase [Kiritimatiellaeota bacterium B1221]
MMIKACIFDFDGILADTEALHYRSYQAVLEPLGAGFSWETYLQNYIAFDSRQAFAAALKVAQIQNPPPVSELLERKMQAHETAMEKLDLPPLPGAVEAVRLAAGRGPVGLCTGAQPRDVLPLIEAFGISDLFSALVTADDVRISKPDPESYRLAAQKLGIPASECLAIEDTPGGLRSARGAGCQTLGITTTHTREQLEGLADQVIESLVGFSAHLDSL